MIDDKLVKIDSNKLKLDKALPVRVYIFNKLKNKVNQLFEKESVLTKDHLQIVKYITSKQACLCINSSDMKVFYEEYRNEPVPDLFYMCREEIQKINSLLLESLENDDFTQIIEHIRNSLGELDLYLSYDISLANILSQSLLKEDDRLNRAIAIAYTLACNLNYSESRALSSIILTCYLSHLGFLFLDQDLHQTNQIDFNEWQEREYKKHPALSATFVSQMEPFISKQTSKLIFEHHERIDGNGYPSQKKGDFVDRKGCIIDFAFHLVDFSSGKITGDKIHLLKLLGLISSDQIPKGFSRDFPQEIIDFTKVLMIKYQTAAIAA